jgi:enoyl-CoA hydratase/carnithine racemase
MSALNTAATGRFSTRTHVRVEADGPVAELAFENAPLNLMTGAMLAEMNAALEELAALAASRDIRCLVVHGGASRAFCAGSDIREFAGLAVGASVRKILPEDMLLRRLARLPMPTIAAIDGPALGGGLELALACDLRIVRTGVPLGFTECRLGGLAGSGAVRAARLIGPARTKELLFTGDTIATDVALAWGLVNEVVEGSALAAGREWAARIARRGPLSNRLAKSLVEAALDEPIDAALSAATVAQQRIFDSADLHRGVDAFFAKRDAEFEGR